MKMSNTPRCRAASCSVGGTASGPPMNCTCSRPFPFALIVSIISKTGMLKVWLRGNTLTSLSVVSAAAQPIEMPSPTSTARSFMTPPLLECSRE